jgi:hypothetical protein
MSEPVVHNFNADCLPEEHPWAHKTVLCGHCGQMVHAFNNECMQPWVEWNGKVLCADCTQSNSGSFDAFNALASCHTSVHDD